MVTVLIHQASSSVPPLSTPIIDLTPPKAVSPLAQEPVFTATTATKTTTLLPPPPPQQQSTTDPALAARIIHCWENQICNEILKSTSMEFKEAVYKTSKAPERQRTKTWTSFDIRESPSISFSKDCPTSEKPTGDMGSFLNWYCKQIGKKKLSKADLEGPAFKVDLTNLEGNRVVPNVSKPLPLGGLLVRSHMRILSVVSLKTFSRYGYTYLKKIILRRADYKEYKISEADLKNLHPNDFEDMYLLHLQGNLNHLSGADKVHLFNAVNLWIRNIVIRKCVEELQLGICQKLEGAFE
ncbi:hypothetical protein Tco_0599358 [Tanacetum coccineum]